MSQDSAGKILNEFGEDETLGHTNYTWEDFRILVPAGVLALLILSMVPGDYWLLGAIVSGGLVVFSLLLIYLAPSHRPAHEWLKDRFTYATQPDIMRPHDPTTTDNAQTITQIDMFLRGLDLRSQNGVTHGAVKRTDGALVGAIEIIAPALALADLERRQSAARSFEDFVNSLPFDIQIYSTARDVDVATLTRPYRERLAEPDQKVRENDQLRGILETYRDRLPNEFAQRGTRVREFYIFVSVSEMEIHLQDQDSMSKLSDLPVVGTLFRSFGKRSSDISEQEMLYYQKRELNNRFNTLYTSIQDHLSGCEAQAVSSGQLCNLLEEYWTGQRIDYPESDGRIHSIPIVTGADNSEVSA